MVSSHHDLQRLVSSPTNVTRSPSSSPRRSTSVKSFGDHLAGVTGIGHRIDHWDLAVLSQLRDCGVVSGPDDNGIYRTVEDRGSVRYRFSLAKADLKGDLVHAQVRERSIERQTGPERRPVEDRGNASQVAVRTLTLSRFPTKTFRHQQIERRPVEVKKRQKMT